MIDQIRHLQSVVPFETFAIELAKGRVIQVHDKHHVATTEGARNGEGVIGVLYHGGIFELINARQIASVGLHPKVKADLSERMESARKGFEGRTEAAQ